MVVVNYKALCRCRFPIRRQPSNCAQTGQSVWASSKNIPLSYIRPHIDFKISRNLSDALVPWSATVIEALSQRDNPASQSHKDQANRQTKDQATKTTYKIGTNLTECLTLAKKPAIELYNSIIEAYGAIKPEGESKDKRPRIATIMPRG